MNSKTNGLIKFAVVIILTAFIGGLYAAPLNVNVEHKRFLDASKNTVHDFNYKVSNNELTFAETEDGFLAKLDITISTEDNDGNLNKLKEFTRYIGVRNKEAALSTTNYYIDKISLTLSKADISIYIGFKDQLSNNETKWAKTLQNLDKDALVSELEFSHMIVKDKPHPGMEQFLRGNYQFYVDPVHIYQKALHDTVFFYYEVQNLFPAANKQSYFDETINIRSEQDSLQINNVLSTQGSDAYRIHRIPVSSLKEGYYTIDVAIHDKFRNRTETINDYFVVTEKRAYTFRIFHDAEQEMQLLKYFLPSSYFSSWSSMSDTAKGNLIDRFWRQNNPNPQSDTNEFMQTIKERINYVNRNYSTYAEGWLTDIGRIYIRNGQPDDIEKNYAGGDIKLTRREYQIWRYRNLNRVYLFIDVQGTGNFRLIYIKNDDMETTTHDWERYVGEEFDKDLLEQ